MSFFFNAFFLPLFFSCYFENFSSSSFLLFSFIFPSFFLLFLDPFFLLFLHKKIGPFLTYFSLFVYLFFPYLLSSLSLISRSSFFSSLPFFIFYPGICLSTLPTFYSLLCSYLGILVVFIPFLSLIPPSSPFFSFLPLYFSLLFSPFFSFFNSFSFLYHLPFSLLFIFLFLLLLLLLIPPFLSPFSKLS